MYKQGAISNVEECLLFNKYHCFKSYSFYTNISKYIINIPATRGGGADDPVRCLCVGQLPGLPLSSPRGQAGNYIRFKENKLKGDILNYKKISKKEKILKTRKINQKEIIFKPKKISWE